MCVSVRFWGFVRDFENEMGEFEKSAKTTHTPPRVPFQTKTRARDAAEVFAAKVSAAETAAANTYYRHRLTTRAWWLVVHAWGLIHVWWPMTHRRWRLTDGRCTPAYSSLWNTLWALKLNQMSTTLLILIHKQHQQQTWFTQPIRLGYSSFGNRRSFVENSVTPVNLSLGYNLKPDIYDSRILCLLVRLLYLIVWISSI